MIRFAECAVRATSVLCCQNWIAQMYEPQTDHVHWTGSEIDPVECIGLIFDLLSMLIESLSY